jgi:hypothetical protein
MTIPFGTYTKAVRMGALASVVALAKAGTMASNMGSPIATPNPFQKGAPFEINQTLDG